MIVVNENVNVNQAGKIGKNALKWKIKQSVNSHLSWKSFNMARIFI